MNDSLDEAAFRRLIDSLLTNPSGAAAELAKYGPSGVRVVASMLADPDPATRERAARAAESLGHHATDLIPIIVRVLGDPSERVRQAAASAIGRMGAAATGPLLSAIQGRPDSETLHAACTALAEIGPWAESVWEEILSEMLALYREGCDRPADELRTALWRMSAAVRGQVAGVVYESPEIQTFEHQRNRYRSTTATRFFDLAVEVGPFAVPEAIQHLDSPHLGVRYAAVAGLANAADTRRPTICTPWSGVRRAAGSVGFVDTSPGLAGLVALLEAPDQEARLDAIEALGRGGPGAAGPLVSVLGREEPESDAALYALGHLGPAAASQFDRVRRLVREQGAGVRESALFALGRIAVVLGTGLPDLVEAFRRLPDPGPRVRDTGSERVASHFRRRRHRVVVEAIAALAPSPLDFLPEMVRFLDAGHPLVGRAIDELGRAALPALSAASRAGELTQAELVGLLFRIGEPGLPALADALDDLGPSVAALEFLEAADEGTVARLVGLMAAGAPAGRHALLSAFLYHGSAHLSRNFGRLLAATFVAADRGESVGMVAADPTDRRVLDHLARLDRAAYLPKFRTFWAVGLVERDAMRARGPALGFGKLGDALAVWRDRSREPDLGVSVTWVRECLVWLEDLFDGRELHAVWGTGEEEPAFRIDAPTGRRKGHRWAPRADRAWRWVDLFLARHRLRPHPGGDPGPNGTIDTNAELCHYSGDDSPAAP